jgi:hypothetical protein
MIARVYPAINAITQAFAADGIAKTRINLDDHYAYRAIDDVLDRLAPLLATHKLCVLPRVLEREASERIDPEGAILSHVALRAAFDLVSAEDGSSHTIEAYGEALDHSDKATAKAMTAAYKAAVLQAFCIPVSGSEDADQRSPRLGSANGASAPVEGWRQWADDLSAVVGSCMSGEAIDRLLAGKRAQLAGLARECPEHYAALGQAIATRRQELDVPAAAAAVESKSAADASQDSNAASPRRNRKATKPPRATRRSVKVAPGTAPQLAPERVAVPHG